MFVIAGCCHLYAIQIFLFLFFGCALCFGWSICVFLLVVKKGERWDAGDSGKERKWETKSTASQVATAEEVTSWSLW